MQTKFTVLDVKETMETRRSIRKYVQEPIPQEDPDALLRLTSLAPSAWNVQPWRITVVTDPELKARLQEAAYGQKQVGGAPAVFVLTADMEDTLANPNIALGFFLVAATGLGYATSPMTGFDPARVKEVLGLPEHVKVTALVAVGRAAEEGAGLSCLVGRLGRDSQAWPGQEEDLAWSGSIASQSADRW